MARLSYSSNSKIKKFGWIVAVLACLALAMLGFYLARNRSPDHSLPPGQHPPSRSDVPNYVPTSDVAAATTVEGAGVCAQCHADIVADYKRSGMSHSWRPAAPELAAAANQTGDVIDRLDNFHYQIAFDRDAIYQVETRADDPAHQVRRRAEYLVGSGNHAQAMVFADHGYLWQMPVAWFREPGQWRMNPGFELKNHRFSRPIAPGCAACHGARTSHQPPTRNRFHLPIAGGIDCARCHGPGQRHVEFWNSDRAGAVAQAANADAAMVHPGSLPPQAANDICLQCHLQGDVALYRPGSAPASFRPGERLQDHRADFLIATDQPDELGVASHGARMLQSRCYTASGGRLTCILCHDAHRPSSDFDSAFFDSKCATCHTPQSCNRERPAGLAPSPNGCVACHMPPRPTREGIHLVFTDHAISRTPPAPRNGPPAPTVLQPNSPVELISCWPNETPRSAELGAAYILLHESMGPQLPSLEKGCRLLAEVVAADAGDVESRYWLGAGLVGLRRTDEAIAPLSEVLARDPQRFEARFYLALAQEAKGNHSAAIANYQKLLDQAPSWMAPYPRLALLHLAARQADAAVRVLKQQLDHQENALAYAQLALAQRLAGDSHQAAMVSIAKALEIDPRLPTAYLHRATLYLLERNLDQARADYQKVLELEPDNPQALQALQSLSR